MGKRVDLQHELESFISNVYYQPPSTIKMTYPCIVYFKNSKSTERANDSRYLGTQGYQITLMEHNPDSEIADDIEGHFEHCAISQYFTVDNLNHTTLNLFY